MKFKKCSSEDISKYFNLDNLEGEPKIENFVEVVY